MIANRSLYDQFLFEQQAPVPDKISYVLNRSFSQNRVLSKFTLLTLQHCCRASLCNV